MAWQSAVTSHFIGKKMKDACMYTLYHMLSFILFIVPIFLIYLLPRLSPNTSSCSFRLCIAGYQKGVGKNTPWWLGIQQVSTAVCALSCPDVLQEGACWEELRDTWVCQCLNCDFSSPSGLARSEYGGHSSVSLLPTLLGEQPRWDGAGRASPHKAASL